MQLTTAKCPHQFTLMRALAPARRKTPDRHQIDLDREGRLFVGGIPYKVTHEELMDYFAGFGEVISLILPSHESKAGLNRGFGFLMFKDASVARTLLCSTKDVQIRSKTVDS